MANGVSEQSVRSSGFARGLESLIGRPTDLRPFVCDGSPLTCRVFIVGTNPGTPVGDWWTFWSDDYGFDKSAWSSEYVRRRGRVGRTHQSIAWLVDAAQPVRCLVTNFNLTESQRPPRALGPGSVLDYLLATVAPELVITHGMPAQRHLQTRRGEWRNLWHERHFMYCSREKAKRLGANVRSLLCSPGARER